MKLEDAIKDAERIAGGDTTNISVGEVIRTLLAEIHLHKAVHVPHTALESEAADPKHGAGVRKTTHGEGSTGMTNTQPPRMPPRSRGE